MAISDADTKVKVNKMALILLGFSFLCFATSLFMNRDSGQELSQTYSELEIKTSPVIGPIDVQQDHTVFNIKVEQDLYGYGSWSYVSGEVLSANQEYLFGFGDEFWKEQGYDSDGRWQEQVTDYELKVTIPTKGSYFLRFNAETSENAIGNIKIKVTEKAGSSLAHFILGLISVIVGGGLWVVANTSMGDF